MTTLSKKSKPVRPKRARVHQRLAAHENGRCRIVLTGGPGGGKTTAADLFRREIGERVVTVPEAATLVFSGGFPRCTRKPGILAAQHAIFHVQRDLEDVQSSLYPDRILLCDRGTVDGGAYWPGAPAEFFAALGTTLEHELARYDGVIFLKAPPSAAWASRVATPCATSRWNKPQRSTQSFAACGRSIRASSS